MASTVARNQQDVDQMSRKDRLWDSLSYSYGKQKEASNKAYDQAISQQDNAMLSRGMQRSSLAAAARANLYEQKLNAENDIGYAQNADYENRLFQLEQQEKADEQWERQFAESQRQYDQGFAYQKESDDRKFAYDYLTAIAARGGNASDDLLSRAGLSRADYDLFKTQQSTGGGGRGGLAAWQKAGFRSAADFKAANGRSAAEFYGNQNGDPIEAAGRGNNELDLALVDKLRKLDNDKRTVSDAYGQSLINNDIRAVRKALGYKD